MKWDQIVSESPLPKTGRHSFSCLIEGSSPDFMFGVCSTKVKGTQNAFMSLDAICIYATKNNCHIYERGKHYKISLTVNKNDLIIVVLDFDKNSI